MQVEAVQPEVLILRLLQDLEEECQDSAADLVEDCRNPGRPSRETLQVSQVVKLAEFQCEFEGRHSFEACKSNALFMCTLPSP